MTTKFQRFLLSLILLSTCPLKSYRIQKLFYTIFNSFICLIIYDIQISKVSFVTDNSGLHVLYTSVYGAVRDHTGPYGTKRDHTGPYLAPYGTLYGTVVIL